MVVRTAGHLPCRFDRESGARLKQKGPCKWQAKVLAHVLPKTSKVTNGAIPKWSIT